MAWVFAYGSLMGDAVLRRYPARPARLAGLPPRLRPRVPAALGLARAPLPDPRPGPGGECWGLAFEVPADDEARIARDLAQREASAGAPAGDQAGGDAGGRGGRLGLGERGQASGEARRSDARGASARRARHRGDRRRVRADASSTRWSRTASRTRSSTSSGRGCGAESDAALHHRRGRLRERPPEPRGPRPLHAHSGDALRRSTTWACAITCGARRSVGRRAPSSRPCPTGSSTGW